MLNFTANGLLMRTKFNNIIYWEGQLKGSYEVELVSVSFAAASSSSFFFQYSSSGGPNIAFPETTPMLQNPYKVIPKA
ncbi:hypothetical protein D5086_014456 [Populus alba]|uniref:Uncharacterized protein n=1 Tax=Populus alba TaxID=43335 RepID=A0ACC4BYC3_POPAL